jgi:phosphoribosylformylglycinamidine synthase
MASVGIVVFPGSCDEHDAARAVGRTPGLEPQFLWHADSDLGGVDAVIVPGGFSYGDYLRAGAIARFAPVMEQVARFAAGGGPVLGICNGFQVLCEAGLLPGALLPNTSLRFVCRQVDVIVGHAHGVWTSECEPGEVLSLPVKHGFGRWHAPAQHLDELERKGQLVLRYAPGQNPNGSVRDVAGVMNEGGNVLGLMPHPEHAVDELNGSADASRLFGSLAASLGAASPVAA